MPDSRRRTSLKSCLGILAFGPSLASAAVVISGSLQSEVGNQGNPVTIQYVAVQAPGSYAAGPLTGSGGANTTSGEADVVLGPVVPMLNASATGSTGATSLDGASTTVTVDLSYGFKVIGPAPAAVPVLFAGTTDGALQRTGDASRFYGFAGTRLRIISDDIAGSFSPDGLQTGTAPDYYASNASQVNLGWGAQAFGPVGYTDYASTWTWEAILGTGQVGTMVMSTSLRGGTAGALRGIGEFTSSSAQTMLDPHIFIDPAWLAVHPGYAIVVDPGVGNVSPVPEAPATAFLLCGLALVAGKAWRFNRHGNRGVPTCT